MVTSVRKILSLLTASAMVSTQMLGPVQAAAADAGSDKLISTGVIGAKTEKAYPTPYFTASRTVVDKSEAGKTASISFFLNDDDMGDEPYFSSASILVCIDSRLSLKSARNGKTDGTHKMSSETTQVGSSGNFTVYRVAVVGSGEVGKNGTFITFDVDIPADAMPGDVFYADICRVSGMDSYWSGTSEKYDFTDAGFINHVISHAISGEKNGEDPYLDGTSYEGYIAVAKEDKAPVYGDVNSSGMVDAVDSTLIEKYVRGTEEVEFDKTVADVDGDGILTLRDSQVILEHYARLSTNNDGLTFPYTGEVTWRNIVPDASRYRVIDIGMDYPSAKAYCESLGGHLVTITSQEEQSEIEELLKAKEETKINYWIGLEKNDAGEFVWITGEESEYTNWNSDNPNNIGGDQNAVLLYGQEYGVQYSWDDINESGNCGGSSVYGTGNFGFICEFENVGTPCCIGTSKYQVFDEGVTWNEAKSFCAKLGGHLATIADEAEQKAIEYNIACKTGKPYLWIGGQCAEDRVFTWITGEPMDYTNWSGGQPDNDGGSENCLMIYTPGSRWNDTANNGYAGITSHMGFICEWDDVEDPAVTTEPATTPATTTTTVTTTVTTTATTTTTAPVTLPLENYEVFDLGMTWYEAEAYCEAHGGHLMVITSQEEENTAEALLDALEDGKNSYWLGGIRDASGNFGWVTGEEWDYTHWAGGQPDNSYENALMLYNRYNPYAGTATARKWNDLKDDGTFGSQSFFGLENFGFICEYEELPEPFVTTAVPVTTVDTTTTTTVTTAAPTTAKPKPKTTAVPTTKKPVTTKATTVATTVAPTEAPTEAPPVTTRAAVPITSAYYVYEKDMTWEEAKEFCEKIGGHLAVITSEEEMQAVVDAVAEIGTNKPYIWLGSCRNENGDFVWITGEPMVYTNWAAGEPNSPNSEPCMMMYHNGTWNDCHETGNYSNSADMAFVCEWESGIQPTVTAPAEPADPPEPPAPRRLDIDGEMKVTEMTIDQIRDAGIDLDDPSNYHVFSYEIKMEFEAEAYIIHKYDVQPVGGTASGGGDVYWDIQVNGEPAKIVHYVETEHEEMFMIIKGECKWLKEFYDVELLVFNRDNEESLTDCTAELNVPKGLTLANCQAIQDLGTLGPNQMFDVHWYVRGDEAGDYDLTSVFKGKNRGEEFKYDFKSKNTLHVYAGNALKMTIQLPRCSAFNTDYMATIIFENVSDKPIYNIEHSITNITQGSKLTKRKYIDGKLVEESVSVTPLQTYNPNARYEVGQLDPGDKIVAEVTIHDIWKSILQQEIEDKKLAADWIVLLTCWSKNPYIMGINAVASVYSTILDNIAVVHVLKNVSVVTLPESTTQVPYEVQIIDNTDDYAVDLFAEVAKDLAFGLLGDSDNPALSFLGNTASYIDDTIDDEKDWKHFAYNSAQYVAGMFDPSGAISPALTICQDYYYKLEKPEGSASVTFYTLRREAFPTKKAGAETLADDFDIEVLSGDYTVDEDGKYIFTSDAIIKLTPKTPDIDALLCVSTDDGKETKTVAVHTVDEHVCSGEYAVLASPSDGDGAIVASFCKTCHGLIDCTFIPKGATAFLTDGSSYQDIRGALEDVKELDNKNLFIFGNVDIVEDVEVPEDVILVIEPQTLITEKNGARITADGEVKDFSGYNYDLSKDRAEALTTAPAETPGTPDTATTAAETPTEPATTEPAVNYGDVNEDGAVDSLDASLILVHYAALSTGDAGVIDEKLTAAADLDKDGKIDANDASAVLAYYAYLSTSDVYIAILDFMKDYVPAEKTEAEK